MFSFEVHPLQNKFFILTVDYCEIRGFSGPDKYTEYAILFDIEYNQWIKYHGEKKDLNKFLNQSREVIYSAMTKYQTHVVSLYFPDSLSPSARGYDDRWLRNIALAHIGLGWTKDWNGKVVENYIMFDLREYLVWYAFNDSTKTGSFFVSDLDGDEMNAFQSVPECVSYIYSL